MSNDAITTVADALGTRPDTLEAFIDDDTTAAEVLGRFGAAPTYLKLVKAWLAGEPLPDIEDTAGGPTKTGNKDRSRTGGGVEKRNENTANGEESPGPDTCNEDGSDTAATWSETDFTTPRSGAWPAALLEREQWMGHVEKRPFAPWGDRDADLECGKARCIEHGDDTPDAVAEKCDDCRAHREGVSTAECSHDARYKWGHAGHYVDGERIAMAEVDPRLDGRAFLQQESDSFMFVDGDDVRCPETGEVHPVFVDLLERLGVTYADVSTSGAGAHAYYRGTLPNGVKEATFAIDDEAWGANPEDDLPEVEIYDGKHVCVATGEHVPGTPLSIVSVDNGALERILREYDELDDTVELTTEREAFDLDEYDPDATGAGETTEDLRDVFIALDRLDARAVAEKTIVRRWLEPAGTENRAFVPIWAPSGYDGTANFANERAWTDSGTHGGYGGPACLAAIDCPDLQIDETDCPTEPTGADWFRAVEHLRSLGFAVPEYVGDGGAKAPEERDPREVDVTPDPEVAWRATAAVVPTDLEGDLPLEVGVDGGTTAWRCPTTGELVNIVRAVAIADGLVDTAADPLDGGTYHSAYARAREVYGAPLPRYVTTEDATARFDVLLAAIGECGFHHLDRDALRSDVTAEGDEVGGDAELALDPAWRLSESGGSVLVFPSGTIWDADTETTLDIVRFVALEAGLLGGPAQKLKGERFTEAVRLAREEYRAPLPRWHTGTPDNHVPLLPPAETLIEDARPEGINELQEAREAVEALYRDLATGIEDNAPAVLSVLPSLGKTTSAVKAAADRPTTYLAPRKELQADALARADEEGLDAMHLPVMGGSLRDEVLTAAVEDVREHDKDRLRDRWSILAEADNGDGVFEESDGDDNAPDLDRPTCACAEGAHGEDWALVVHVARELDFSPRDIHTRDKALFGTTLPCREDGECEYTEGWNAVSDPDHPPDLLIGNYVHAYVESARTVYTRSPNGGVNRAPRTVVLDEFPGVNTFADEYGREAFDHAAWLAGALRDDVEDVRDVDQTDLWGDEYIRAWLDGEGDDIDSVADLCATLEARADLLKAREAAGRVLSTVDESNLKAAGLLRPLHRVHDGDGEPERSHDALCSPVATLERTPEGDLNVPTWVLSTVADEILPLLASVTESDRDATTDTLEALGVGEELRTLVEGALEAADRGDDGATGRLRAARAALQGGGDGARELAVWADDGWAHRDAHHLLRGCITPTDDDRLAGAHRLETTRFAFDENEDGTILDRVAHNGVTTLVDRNSRGAVVHAPPSRTAGSGETAPFVGLDATARPELWTLALGECVETHDIHDTPRRRRRFLRDVLGLQVVQVGEEARPYEGDPDGKDLDGDASLLRELRERFTGIKAARARDGTTREVGRPACITTKVVRDRLEARDDLDDIVAAWDNYGNVTGDNDLGKHTLAAILGTQHYGHAAVEKLAAIGGEEVRPSGRGINLKYGSDLAEAYLRHMREDQLMQAALRFTRGDTGALVVCRTSAIREDLPLVGEGRVATTWSDTATTLATAARRLTSDTFTVAKLADQVDVSRRHIRRVLAELADAGYLRRVREGEGIATEYGEAGPTPEAAEFDLPDASPPGREAHTISYTANVRVPPGDSLLDTLDARPGSVLPAPDAFAEGDPPG